MRKHTLVIETKSLFLLVYLIRNALFSIEIAQNRFVLLLSLFFDRTFSLHHALSNAFDGLFLFAALTRLQNITLPL